MSKPDFRAAVRDDSTVEAISVLRRQLAKSEHARKRAEDDCRHAEKLLESQLETIERQRAPGFEMPKGRKPRPKKGDFCRVIIPDTHGCHVDGPAAAAMLRDLEVLKPTEVILMGDHLDCGGFLAAHHVMGYVAESAYSFEDDVNACNTLFDQLQQAAPHATYDYLCGNHEHRVEKWCVTQTLRHQKDAAFLLRQFGPPAVLSLAKRGIAYRTLYEYHDGLPVQGAIRRGKCCFVHGISHAKHAAQVTLDLFGGNVCFAHTHRPDMWVKTLVGPGTIGAWAFGCLCKLQPYYMHGRPSGHSHGYGFQLVRATGEFLTLQVPIINGESLLGPLLSRLQ